MRRNFALLSFVLLVGAVGALWLAAEASAGPMTIVSSGTTQLRSTGTGTEDFSGPEIRHRIGARGSPLPSGKRKPPFPFPRKPLDTPKVDSSSLAGSNPELGASFNGLTSRDQRLANGGNQFSVEPPDQALCVANGRILESVNTVIRVRDASGGNLTGVVDLNTFYNYPAQVVRPNGPFGPFITDPVCLWVPEINRFVHVVLTLEQGPTTGNFLGPNHLDVAISNTADPTGTWTIYPIPAQNDGTQGTPDNGCPTPAPADVPPGATNPRAEIGDYPHVGMDENGIYLSTNGYCFFSSQFNGTQLYAIGLDQLKGSLPMSINLLHIPNTRIAGTPGFTVWPATSYPGEGSTEAGGTEYFLSTLAGDGSETGNTTGTAKRLGVWALTNTSSLNTQPFAPNVQLQGEVPRSQTYVFPPLSDQKPGPTPLRDCINDTTLPTIFGPGCWQLLFVEEPEHNEVISTPDSLDSRMQQTWYVNGRLWGASGTGVEVGGETKAGIAWFAVEPRIGKDGRLKAQHIWREGYLALANNNLTMPALAIRPDNKGVLAFTVVGEDHFPSAGYAVIDGNKNRAKEMVGPIHIAAAGLGPDDGFTSYKAFVGDPPRTRWGDYGAAWIDGNDIWIASEYIGQSCTLAQYYLNPPSLAGFGSCGGTRVTLTNWFTRISRVTP